MQETYMAKEARLWAAIRLSDWHRLLPSWMWCADIDSLGGALMDQTFVEVKAETRRAAAIIEYKFGSWAFDWTWAIKMLAALARDAGLPFFVVRYHPMNNTFDIWEVEHGGGIIKVTHEAMGKSARQYCEFLASLHGRTLPDDFVVPEFPEYKSTRDRIEEALDDMEDKNRASKHPDLDSWTMTAVRKRLLA
jgi:hypothetical protein